MARRRNGAFPNPQPGRPNQSGEDHFSGASVPEQDLATSKLRAPQSAVDIKDLTSDPVRIL